VFVGDLIDRGSDQLATVEFVRAMVEAGAAHCVYKGPGSHRSFPSDLRVSIMVRPRAARWSHIGGTGKPRLTTQKWSGWEGRSDRSHLRWSGAAVKTEVRRLVSDPAR
jgi:hypothetical protein